MSNAKLLEVPPTSLVLARRLSHAAVQWASRAARANLTARADDGHSNLGWDDTHAALISHTLDGEGRCQLGLRFNEAALIWLAAGEITDALTPVTEDQAQAWCDQHLEANGLRPTGRAEMPYTLESVEYGAFAGAQAELETLGAWFATAHRLLEGLVEDFGSLALSPPAVRCWPHHFDLATLFVLDDGDPETARSVGVGLSPGDESYAMPYFYCTPWPVPTALPEASENFVWHTEGFTSMVCPADRIDTDTNLQDSLSGAVKLAFDVLQA